MIHPLFKSIPDRLTAEAFSAPFVNPGEYKFTESTENHEKYGTDVFPPVPAHIMSMLAAYLEKTPTGDSVRTRFVGLSTGSDMPTSTEIADLYESTVGTLQGQLTGLGKIIGQLPEFRGREAAIQRWCMDTTRKRRKVLLAAHIVGRVADSGELIDTVAYPTEFKQDLPLILRNSVFKWKSYVDLAAEQEGADSDLPWTQEVMRQILSGGDITASLGAVAASSLLPSAEHIRPLLRAQLNPR